MKLPFRLTPWRRRDRAAAGPTREGKTFSPVLTALAASTGAPAGRSYAALSRDGFLRNPVAHRALRLVAEVAAAVPLLLRENDRETTEHPLSALLARPNQRHHGIDFLEALYGHLLLSGNAYVTALSIGSALRELHLLRPDRVRVIDGPDGWAETYEYRAATRPRRFSASDGSLLHLRLFHPLDDQTGYAPLSAAAAAIDLSNAAAAWNKALIDNSARPSGALVYQPKEGGNLSPDQFQRLRDELDHGFSGAVRAGRPLLLEGGLDWKAMGLSPRDMDFAGLRDGAARDIALALGVPPMLLGIPGDNTYANYQEANRALYRLTVLPLVGRTAASLSGWFSEAYGADLSLVPDLDQVAGLSLERSELWSRLGGADFLTQEEKRSAVGY